MLAGVKERTWQAAVLEHATPSSGCNEASAPLRAAHNVSGRRQGVGPLGLALAPPFNRISGLTQPASHASEQVPSAERLQDDFVAPIVKKGAQRVVVGHASGHEHDSGSLKAIELPQPEINLWPVLARHDDVTEDQPEPPARLDPRQRRRWVEVLVNFVAVLGQERSHDPNDCRIIVDHHDSPMDRSAQDRSLL